MASIIQLRKDVDSSVAAVVATVETAGGETANEVETKLWSALLELGRCLMALLFALRAERWQSPWQYQVEGATYEVLGTEGTSIGTRFGKVKVQRPVGRMVGVVRAARDLPLERELELSGGFTLPVVMLMSKLCAHMAFAQARSLFKGMLQWTPSSRAVLRMVDAVGEHARPFLSQTEVPEDDGEVLVVTVDGKGAPAISSQEYERRARPHGNRDSNRRHQRRSKRKARSRPRRHPGQRSKNAKMAAVGVLYTLKRNQDGRLEGPLNKRVYATFESYRALFEWLHQEAARRGYGTSRFSRVLFVADGADVLWSLQQEYFPDAEVCLDFYHIVEKLWTVGKAIYRGRSKRQRKELEAWVSEQKQLLRNGRALEVIDAIEAALDATALTGPGNKYRREVLDKTAAHLRKNLHRMRYKHLRQLDLDIGSGVVEGAVRHLVGVRLDGPGMRWGRDRSEAVLQLRCVLINGLWDSFEHYVENQHLRLLPQPIPTRTHDAVSKIAA